MRERIGGEQGASVAQLEIAGPDFPGCVGMPLTRIVIPINTTPSGSEQDTNIDLPVGAIVFPIVGINVRTAEAGGGTKTMAAGLLSSESGGDADGFIAGLDVSSTGMKMAKLANGAETLGALLKETTSSGPAPMPHAQAGSSSAKSITYTAASSDWTTFRGDLVLFVAMPASA